MKIFATIIDSPVGRLFVAVDEAGRVAACQFARESTEEDYSAIAEKRGDELTWDAQRCAEPVNQLRQYFRGEREQFDLRYAMRGTDFQRSVWNTLNEIPFGETVSYLWVAQKIGNPKAVRAVGAANGANPIAVLVPCHRVIGASGSLVGYGGGMEAKKILLEHERAQKELF